jgi:hypothetical protein
MSPSKLWVLLAAITLAFPAVGSAQEGIDLGQVIARSLQILGADTSLPENQRNRLICMMTLLRDNSSADGRYVPESFLVRSQNDRMTDEQLNLIMERVRRDMQRPIAFGADKSTDTVRGSLERLDLRIFRGIAYLNRVAGDGLAVGGGSTAAPGKVQLKDFVSRQQSHGSSIYWCYGEGQE